MIDHTDVLLTLRNRLLNLEIATTGSTTLGSTGNGFTRAAGSFVDDGFVPGMEVQPTGFTDTNPAIILSVSDLEIVVDRDRTVQGEGGGRDLSVGLPSHRVWENIEVTPDDSLWYIDEDYVPGGSVVVTMGPNGESEHQLLYILRLSGLADKGIQALYGAADAILSLFPPRQYLTLSDGNVIRVRTNPSPTRGQALPRETGRAEIVITIPCWLRTTNTV